MLWIDNPVGTGFSFTATDDGYARNEVQVGQNLYEFLMQFYKLFPEYRQTPLYIAGESYAGKYVPAFAYRIYKENQRLEYGSYRYVPLAGVAVGAGYLLDPESMITAYGPLLYNVGLFDQVEADFVTRQQEETVRLIRQGQFEAAFNESSFLSHLHSNGEPSYFYNVTGSNNVFDSRLTVIPPALIPLLDNAPSPPYVTTYLARCDVRNAIHVGNLTFNGVADAPYEFLVGDMFDTVRQWVPTVLDNYRALFYTGQFDIIAGVPLVQMFLAELDLWRQQREYLEAPKVVWRINGPNDTDVAGYVKSTPDGHFHEAVVRSAGHFVLYDQPKRGFDAMQRFVNEIPYDV